MVPRPIKPISIIAIFPCLFPWSCIERQRCVPTEAIDGRRPRFILASDPAAIANRIEMPEQEGKVDLAGAGFIAAGIVGELDMGDPRQMLLQASRDVAL